MSHVLLFCPHCPQPPKAGSSHRVLEMLGALKRLGCRTTLISSSLPLDAGWTEAGMDALLAGGVEDVRVYQPTESDYLEIAQAHRRVRREEHGAAEGAASFISEKILPPGLRSWFAERVREANADTLWVNHPHWHCLFEADLMSARVAIIDSHDLATLNLAMRRALMPFLSHRPDESARCAAPALDERFFEALDLRPHPGEFDVYDQYTHTVAISPAEAEVIGRHALRTRVRLIPMTCPTPDIRNGYCGDAVLAVGPHPFNLQGYFYFLNRVLPLVRTQAPDFALTVTGSWFRGMMPGPAEGVSCLGHVENIGAAYAGARFAVAPNLGGTGESVKIVEAMAHGLPVVAMRAVAAASPIRHGVNGFVATDAQDFAEFTAALWHDDGLRRRLGKAARETVAEERSRERLDQWVAPLLA